MPRKEIYWRDPDKSRADARRWRLADPERARARSRKWNEANREKRREIGRAYEARNRQKRRNWMLKFRFGITAAQYDAMVKRQNGRCAICHKQPRRLGVDHDHKTGAVRGLLCQMCNPAIGMLGDDPAILRSAIAYIEGGGFRA